MRFNSFEIINHSVTIIYQDEVYSEGKKVFGLCDPLSCKVYVALKSPYDGTDLAEDMILHNMHHEIAHYKMYFIDSKFYTNEVKIDLLGAIDAQFEKTRK